MKTTITLPDTYHKKLKKLAVDRSLTMAGLICEAVRDRFFSFKGVEAASEDMQETLPLNQLQGFLGPASTTDKEIKKLKHIWNTPHDKSRR